MVKRLPFILWWSCSGSWFCHDFFALSILTRLGIIFFGCDSPLSSEIAQMGNWNNIL